MVSLVGSFISGVGRLWSSIVVVDFNVIAEDRTSISRYKYEYLMYLICNLNVGLGSS